MSIFAKLSEQPPDPIFGLYQEYLKDTRPEKINLGIGTFRTPDGKPYVLSSVKEAEKRIVHHLDSKEYLPICGDELYIKEASKVLFKEELITVQTPGGGPALKLAGDVIYHLLGVKKIFISEQTWPNHINIFSKIGFQIERYPYYDLKNKRLKTDELLQFLSQEKDGAIIWQPFCQNPTGVDLPKELWDSVLSNRLIPIFDVAYFGMKGTRDEEMYPVDLAIQKGIECFITTSFSKCFGLYAERIGLLSVFALENQAAILSHLKVIIRANYSNPPQHSSLLIREILQDPTLKQLWHDELKTMQSSIRHARNLLGYPEGAGMFSLLPFTAEQIHRLKNEYAIYIPLSGRINFAAVNPTNIEKIRHGFASVA